MDQDTQRELERARFLLAPEYTGIPLTETGPLAAPADIGARAGIGLQVSDPDAFVNIYVFESQAEHAEAFEKLKALAPTKGHYVLYSSNGALLFFGYVDTSGANGDPRAAETRLDTLAEAFAGEE